MARGLEIFSHMEGRKPGIFKSITGRLMDWSMQDERLKVQLFRFVDVLPMLNSSREVARHTQEYLGGEEVTIAVGYLFGNQGRAEALDGRRNEAGSSGSSFLRYPRMPST